MKKIHLLVFISVFWRSKYHWCPKPAVSRCCDNIKISLEEELPTHQLQPCQTRDNLSRKEITLVNRCYLRKQNLESVDPFFLHCPSQLISRRLGPPFFSMIFLGSRWGRPPNYTMYIRSKLIFSDIYYVLNPLNRT